MTDTPIIDEVIKQLGIDETKEKKAHRKPYIGVGKGNGKKIIKCIWARRKKNVKS